MENEHDQRAREITRQSRPAASGNRLQATTGGHGVGAASSVTETRIDDDGRVRRLWMPGDPWTADYYFGEKA